MIVYHGSSNKNLRFNPKKPLLFFTTNKEDAKDNTNNDSQMNKTTFKATKEKKKLTDSIYKGQSFNFNIYTKGLGIQTVKTTMPKENNNK